MTKLLEMGVEAVRELPEERQDLAGELLLALAEQHRPRYRLTATQVEDVRRALEDADRGEFATDEELAALWTKCGL